MTAYRSTYVPVSPTRKSVFVLAIALTALLAGWVGTALAGSDERKGTEGAHELKIAVGPRGTALGGAVVANSYGIESTYWNPAGLATIDGPEAMFSNTQYFADMTVNYVAVATRIGNLGALGLNVKALNVGEILVTTEAAPNGTGDTIDPTFTVIGLTWARQFTDRVRFGGTGNIVTETVRNARAQGVAFDFGVIYATGWNSLQLGVAMKNFGTRMRFSGEDFETNVPIPGSDPTAANRTLSSNSSNFEMPSYFTMSASYDFVASSQYRLTGLGAFQNNNFSGDNMCAALEWAYREQFALRGSYMASITSVLDNTSGSESIEFDSGDDLYSGLALGAGGTVKAGDTELEVDVSWRPLKDDFFDDIIEFGLKLRF